MNRALNHVPVIVPGEGEFGDDDEFLADPVLDGLFSDVVMAYEALSHIEAHGITVAVRWKQKGGRSKGKLVYHAARYIGWDEGDDEHDPHAVMLAHDVELFYGELTDTGAWERRRETVAREVLEPGFVARSQDR